MTQDMIHDYALHFPRFLKKTVKTGKKSLNIQRAMVLDYCSSHADEVWVKYGGADEEWSKFKLEKQRMRVRNLPTGQKYSALLPVKQTKVDDVLKYVPSEFKSFYSSIAGSDEVSSETEESEEDNCDYPLKMDRKISQVKSLQNCVGVFCLL